MNLKEYRKKIDKLDNELITVIAKRLNLMKQIAKYKFRNSVNVIDPKRETKIIKDRIKKFKKEGIKDREFVRKLFSSIIRKSRQVQKKEIKKLK